MVSNNASTPGTSPNMSTAAFNLAFCKVAETALDVAIAAGVPEGLTGQLAPVYKLLYGFAKAYAGYDLSSFAKKCIISAGAALGVKWVWSHVKPIAIAYGTSSLSVPVEHHVGKAIVDWLEAQNPERIKRHMMYTIQKPRFNTTTQKQDLIGDARTAVTSGGFFWFENRPLYVAFFKDTTSAVDKRRFCQLWDGPSGPVDLTVSGDTVNVFSLFETSGSLLDRFVKHVAADKINECTTTTCFTVVNRGRWIPRFKPIRSMDTIDLDEKVKADLIEDVDRFLSPSRARWYGARGIPYKRGYLLSGPPGTGKSSLSLALAGHIRGVLWTLSLGEVRDESHLSSLMENAEKGQVLLIEDIDSAGIVREDMAKVKKKADDGQEEEKGKISLSALLNAIDALADGVLLIMTTNNPESLDKALIRNGRIDKQIYVGNASQAVAQSIFKRFYSEDDSDHDTSVHNAARIAELAAQFANQIPNGKLTPAEIQGFLIPLSDDPEKALAGVGGWVSEIMAAKAAGKNIIGQDGEEEESMKNSVSGSDDSSISSDDRSRSSSACSDDSSQTSAGSEGCELD